MSNKTKAEQRRKKCKVHLAPYDRTCILSDAPELPPGYKIRTNQGWCTVYWNETQLERGTLFQRGAALHVAWAHFGRQIWRNMAHFVGVEFTYD